MQIDREIKENFYYIRDDVAVDLNGKIKRITERTRRKAAKQQMYPTNVSHKCISHTCMRIDKEYLNIQRGMQNERVVQNSMSLSQRRPPLARLRLQCRLCSLCRRRIVVSALRRNRVRIYGGVMSDE